MTTFPDMTVTMDHVSGDGNQAIYRWTLDGTNDGPGGNGNRVRISGYEEWVIANDGLIAASKGYFDEAEYWLRSKTAHVVRVVSFGYINPRRMVAEEVEKALVQVGDMLNFTLWWVIVQMGLRFAFALSLWLTWAFAHGW